MSLKSLPAARAFERPSAFTWDAPADALSRWADGPQAAEADDPATISIYDVIGEDWWTGEGVTAKRIAGALRAVGKVAVTVNINSPGGDMFEGLAIYNLLREHPARVTVRVVGLAASAASLIAMSGDEVLMGTGTQMMIHRAWGLAVGNHHDFAEAAQLFATFDRSMAEVYAARTGKDEADILALLDGPSKASDGTWMTANEAVAQGFADGTFASGTPDDDAKARAPREVAAARRLDAALARAGIPRTERRALLAEVKGGTPGAASTVTPRADDWTAAATRLTATFRS